MRELPIRRVSFWLRWLNSVKFRSTDRPVSFFPFFISFIYFFVFLTFCLFIFNPFPFKWRDRKVTGFNWLIVPLCFKVLNKTYQKLVEQYDEYKEKRESNQGAKERDARVNRSFACSVRMHARVRAFTHFFGNQRDTSVVFFSSFCWCLLFLSRRLKQKRTHITVQSPISSNPFCWIIPMKS